MNTRNFTSKYEAADGRDEARQEWIERECSNKHTVHELQDSSQKNVGEVRINQF